MVRSNRVLNRRVADCCTAVRVHKGAGTIIMPYMVYIGLLYEGPLYHISQY